ncbi:MAG: glyoxalase, partial [Rhodospirillaceae bacterium]|nr:glyoxalase [Rhodospirillaceae bacterium]
SASEARCDHHAYEVDCWNDVRDWADHMSSVHVKLWWGPGRHGPGNNLFFMIQDPHGHQVEISAELEIMPREMAPRTWPLEERSLNLWGPGWMRA